MGGSGSGRPKTRDRRLIEDCDCIDINEIMKYGFILYPALAFIEHKPRPKHLSIQSIYNSNGLLIPFHQKIQLQTTRPYLGGKRYWFKCPNCNQRVGKLYKPSGSIKYKCGKCRDLMYQSQQSNVYDGWFKKDRRELTLYQRN